MRVISNSKLSTYTLVAVEPEEDQVLSSIAAIIEAKDMMFYYGGELHKDGFYTLNLRAYGKKDEHIDLVLSGSTENDKYEINGIYTICHSRLNGLFFLNETEVDGKKAIVTSYKY